MLNESEFTRLHQIYPADDVIREDQALLPLQ